MTMPTPPSTPVFPAGYSPVPSDFDGWVQNDLGFLTGSVVFRGKQTVQQPITPGGTFVVLSLDTVLEDPYSGWVPSLNRWEAPFTGWYEVTVFASVATQAVILQTAVDITNAIQYIGSGLTLNSSTLGGGCTSVLVPMIGGTDYIQAQAETSAAADTDVSSQGRQPSMEITFVSQG